MIVRKMDLPHGILVKVRAAKDVSNLSRGSPGEIRENPDGFRRTGTFPPEVS
jgi:hypothetical protein